MIHTSPPSAWLGPITCATHGTSPASPATGPAGTTSENTKAEDNALIGPASTRPLRVLIVEDEAIVAMDIEMLLEDLGAEVVGIAMSGAEANALAAQHHPDVMTMDINIKGDQDGVSTAQEIFETLGIRSIFISAYSDLATRERAAPCQAIAWIEKPISSPDLALAVMQVKPTTP